MNWINCNTLLVNHLKMKMRSCAVACASHLSNDLTSSYTLTNTHEHPTAMGIPGERAIMVADLNR